MIKIIEEIRLETTEIAENFFTKHKKIYDKFIENIRNYCYYKNQNIDLKAMKSYKNLYRMRINDYIIIYKLVNKKITVVNIIY